MCFCEMFVVASTDTLQNDYKFIEQVMNVKTITQILQYISIQNTKITKHAIQKHCKHKQIIKMIMQLIVILGSVSQKHRNLLFYECSGVIIKVKL